MEFERLGNKPLLDKGFECFFVYCFSIQYSIRNFILGSCARRNAKQIVLDFNFKRIYESVESSYQCLKIFLVTSDLWLTKVFVCRFFGTCHTCHLQRGFYVAYSGMSGHTPSFVWQCLVFFKFCMTMFCFLQVFCENVLFSSVFLTLASHCWRTLTCALPLVLSFWHWSATVGRLWLVRSHSSCLFDIGQVLLVNFSLCAPTCLVFLTWYAWKHLTPCDMHGDIDHHVICMETFDTMWHASRLWLPCDMHWDIDHHVIYVETLTTMWYAWRHLPLCDMYGDIDHHVICMETFTSVWYVCRHLITPFRHVTAFTTLILTLTGNCMQAICKPTTMWW